jgi:hypothetical protein
VDQELVSVVELCVCSKRVQNAASLISSMMPCLAGEPDSGGSDRVAFHIQAPTGATSAKFALPRFRKLSTFFEDLGVAEPQLRLAVLPDHDNHTEIVQRGKISPVSNAFEGAWGSGVSVPDSLGLATLQMSGRHSAADFVESAVGMTLLGVLAIDGGTQDHIELYFYGFNKTAPITGKFSVLELDLRPLQGPVLDLTIDEPIGLAQVQPKSSDLAFFAEHVRNAEISELQPA